MMIKQAFHLKDFFWRFPVVELEGRPFLLASMSAESVIKACG